MEKINVGVSSEIGLLESVIIHTPGHEVENMTPENAQRALYSDILNLSVATKEYVFLKEVLQKVTQTFEVKDLLRETIENDKVKAELVYGVCRQEDAMDEIDFLLNIPTHHLAKQLIEGVVLRRDNLTRFLSKERYSMRPLHNFLFTRDASITLWDEILIGKMASKVRERETFIMEAIFKYHPDLGVKTINPTEFTGKEKSFPKATIEGGDVLIANDDVLVIGIEM